MEKSRLVFVEGCRGKCWCRGEYRMTANVVTGSLLGVIKML